MNILRNPAIYQIARIVPLLLGIATSSAAPCQTPARLEADARMAAKYSFHFRNLPVRDVLADMNQQTGIRFFSDAGVADNRLSLTVHDRPLAETLTAIAVFYQWQWRRDDPKAGAAKARAGYTLLQKEEARRREQSFINRRLDSLASLLAKEAEAYELLSPLDQKQRERLEEQLPSRIALEKDPGKQEALKVQSVVLQDLHERRLWKPPVYRLMKGLPREQLSALARSSATCFAWPSIPGCSPIPDDRAEELKRIFLQEFVPSGAPRGQIVSLRLRFTLVAGRQTYLRTSLQVGQRSNYGFSTYGMMASMPSSSSLLSENSDYMPPIEPAGWRKDAALSAAVSVRLPKKVESKDTSPDSKPVLASGRAPFTNQQGALPFFWLVDALEVLDAAAPFDSLSDGLWTTRIAGIDMREMPVGDILTRLSRATGHHWWKQGGFVMIRSRTLDADRWAEPPATAVARWKEQIDQGNFRLEDFAEVASLPDAQAMTLQEMSAADQFPAFLSPLNNARGQLILWDALTPAQRRKAFGAGLTYSELSPQQQQLFVLAATDPGASPQSAAIPDARYLARARLRIETQERPYWGVRKPGPFANYRLPRGADPDNAIEKREDIVRRFQSAEAGLKAGDVQAMTLVFHSFIFEAEKEPFARATIQLPPRWESE